MRRFTLWVSFAALQLSALACGQAPEHAPPAAVPATTSAGLLDPTEQPEAPACVGVEVTAEPLPVDLLAVVDGSGSMDEATFTGVSKWYATKAAFRDFLQHAPSDMGFGLSLFPVPGDNSASCSTAHYREAALPIDQVTHMAKDALARLDAVTPQGQTPTAPALTAALELATTYALAHVERSVIVVLATDGMPTECAPTDAAALAALAKKAFDGPAHVRTLVVASPSLAGDDLSGFEFIAGAGGTEHPLTIDPHADFASQLGSALGAAATREVACDMALPQPPPGQHLDYDTVNVVLDGKSRATLPRVSGPAGCTSAGGWYYDIDPARGAPARLDMCKASCTRATSAAKLRVELGCKTLVR